MLVCVQYFTVYGYLCVRCIQINVCGLLYSAMGIGFVAFNQIVESLRERSPPWPRQIITLILPTVKMLSLGCESLPTPLKKEEKKGSRSLPSPGSGYFTTITVFFCSFTHLTIPRSPPKFNQFFLVLLRTSP